MGKFKEMDLLRQEREQALDKMAENARELGLNYDTPLSTFVRSSEEDKAEVMERVIDKAIEAQKKVQPAPVQEPVESWADLHNALQRIDTAAVGLPTFEIRHEGGLDAVVQNIVDAIVALHEGAIPPAAQPAPAPLTDEQAKKLLKDSDLLEMFENIGWYSAPLKGFNKNGLALIRAIEAAHGITKGGERG
jgi:hypothetical protein